MRYLNDTRNTSIQLHIVQRLGHEDVDFSNEGLSDDTKSDMFTQKINKPE